MAVDLVGARSYRCFAATSGGVDLLLAGDDRVCSIDDSQLTRLDLSEAGGNVGVRSSKLQVRESAGCSSLAACGRAQKRVDGEARNR